MSESPQPIQVESIHLRDVAEALSRTRLFAQTPFSEIGGIDLVDRVTAITGTVLVEAGAPWKYYWLVLDGETCAKRPEPDGTWTQVGAARAGEGFGETPLLTCRSASMFRIIAEQDSVLLRFSEQDFWSLLACCPAVRKIVLDDSAQRVQTYQVEALHREKLISLGTLAAGLMHELNNPGSAAKRAASQLRENLLRLQELSLRGSGKPKTPEQIGCMKGLLEHAVGGCNLQAMSSLDQADAEEAMSEWLSQSGVENAYTIGPVLVSMGFDRQEIACVQEHFDAPAFS
ncbi:MAG: cyclic nucleotide-binding domain-containing protein, partial [Terracidiphilus sp.]